MQKDDKAPKPNPATPFQKTPKFNEQNNKGPKSFKNAPGQNFNQRPNRSGGQRGR